MMVGMYLDVVGHRVTRRQLNTPLTRQLTPDRACLPPQPP